MHDQNCYCWDCQEGGRILNNLRDKRHQEKLLKGVCWLCYALFCFFITIMMMGGTPLMEDIALGSMLAVMSGAILLLIGWMDKNL